MNYCSWLFASATIVVLLLDVALVMLLLYMVLALVVWAHL